MLSFESALPPGFVSFSEALFTRTASTSYRRIAQTLLHGHLTDLATKITPHRPIDHIRRFRSKDYLVYRWGNDFNVSGQQYSASFASSGGNE